MRDLPYTEMTLGDDREFAGTPRQATGWLVSALSHEAILAGAAMDRAADGAGTRVAECLVTASQRAYDTRRELRVAQEASEVLAGRLEQLA